MPGDGGGCAEQAEPVFEDFEVVEGAGVADGEVDWESEAIGRERALG